MANVRVRPEETKMTPPPNVLILQDLIDPIQTARQRLSHISEALPPVEEKSTAAKMTLEGFLALAVATIESALADSHAYYLEEFPVKRRRSIVISLEDWQGGRGTAPSAARYVRN